MKGCRYPNFDKTFVFERAKLGPSLTISLRDASGGVKGGSLGHTIVKLDGLEHDIPRQAWHKLRPNPAEVKKLQEGCGSVRFSVSLSHDMILPLQSYNGLVGLLSDSIHDAATVETGLISTLEDILTDRELNADREQVARTLVRILLRQNRCTLFLKTLNDIEIQKSTSSGTLFRGNSMATKCTDQFMKVAGLTYLHGCLKKHIDAIFHEKKDCEIDPQTGRVSKKSDIDKHVGYLSDYITAILESIFTSISNCPASMRQCFKHLQEAVKTNATIMTSSDTPYTVVSGFLFLRFFAPAVLSPKLFGMREELADQRTHRTLTIIAKALQSIGNLVVKAQGAGKVDKEQFMAPLLPLIEQNHDRVRSFIDQLCTLDNKSIQDQFFPSKQVNATDAELVQRDVDSRTALVRGDVPARSESGKLFSNKSFKKRNFVLTHSMLQSSKVGDPTAELIKIPVDKILVAETMEASVHGKHVIVIRSQGFDTIYLNAGSVYDCYLWLQGIRRACKYGARESSLLATYCPGCVTKGSWSCCKSANDAKHKGCSKAHLSFEVDKFMDDPPPETWTHRLFALLMSVKEKLEAKLATARSAPAAENARLIANTDALLIVLDDINLAHLLHQDGGF